LKRIRCAIASIDYFNEDTRRIILELPPGESAEFLAGQYLEIVLEKKNCPFSIASAPDVRNIIELHVRPTPGSEDSDMIEALLDTATEVDIELPKGDCYLIDPPDGPLVLIAASTGITQMKSIIEHLLAQGPLAHPVCLYWGVVADNDLYLADLCEAWSEKDPNFHYTPVVSEPATSPDWKGKIGLVGQMALADFDDPSELTVYVSGGPGMVYATLDAFVEKGMPEESMKSDIFSYAPRVK
jgi:CDP-4-dehydro-6-deoxyglucose reductase